MRPFEREAEGFVIGPKDKYGKYQIRFVDTQRTLYVAVTFEEYLANVVQKCIGPFVALGSPEDFLSPVGAARTYAKDEAWRKDFDQLARSAAAILVEVGKSQNLKWEFEHIREEGWHERLFVITPHPTVSRGYRRVWSRWAQRLKGTSRASWREFSEGLVELGYHPGPDPGPGAILTFDGDAQGVVLTTGADCPQEFVEPISRKVGLLPRARSRECSR